MFRHPINKAIIIAVIIISGIFFVKYGAKSYIFYGDGLGYYMYLPATFIFHNVDNMAELPKDKGIDEWAMIFTSNSLHDQGKTALGKYLNQYTYGVAFTEMPFFMIGYLADKIRGISPNGYSPTYKAMIKLSDIIYALLGLILIYNILKNYFTSTQSLLGITAIFLGTNLFWFTLQQAGMAHVPLFFLYALLVYITIALHKQPKKKHFLAIGFISGLITLIRPTDILCLLIPLLYNVYDKETAVQKIRLIKENCLNIVLLSIMFVLPLIPQLFYWKATTGHYLFYSYGKQSFNWRHPKIIEGLFYFSNGWLPYSPVMIFSIAGFILFARIKKWAWCNWIVFPVYVYVIYSWYCYNYINGLGSRPMIHLYPLLAIPLAAFIQLVSEKKFFIKTLFGVSCIFFISLNIGFSRLQAAGMLKSEESNMNYNFQIFFRQNLTYNDMVVLDVDERQPENDKVIKLLTLAANNFDDSTSANFVKDSVFHGKYIYRMKSEEYSPELSIPYNREQFKDAKWIKCSGRFMYTQPPDYFKHLMVLDVTDKLWKGCKIENKINDKLENYSLGYSEINKWGYVYFYVRIPKKMKGGDVIKFFVWNFPKTEIFMSDLRVELYK